MVTGRRAPRFWPRDLVTPNGQCASLPEAVRKNAASSSATPPLSKLTVLFQSTCKRMSIHHIHRRISVCVLRLLVSGLRCVHEGAPSLSQSRNARMAKACARGIALQRTLVRHVSQAHRTVSCSKDHAGIIVSMNAHLGIRRRHLRVSTGASRLPSNGRTGTLCSACSQ